MKKAIFSLFLVFSLFFICGCERDDINNVIDDGDKKPILYLYPEEEMDISVKVKKPELLKTTYPKYNDGWNVTVKPNGDMVDEDGKYYYALYWDEDNNTKEEFKEGFYVTKDNALEFLEEKLDKIGLNEKEKNEFIMYWLPVLEKNGKNIVRFSFTEELQNKNEIIIEPKPDSLLRVHINIKKVNKKVSIKEQEIKPFNREGYSAVEWGGRIVE